MLDLLIPMLMIGISIAALAKKQDVYAVLLEGGLEGLKLLLSIVPALVMLLTAVHMLRASGAVELLTKWLAPAANFVGIPADSAHFRQRGPCGWCRPDGGLWSGFADWAHRSHHARQHGNDFLHHFGLFWCSWREKNALCDSSGPDCRPHRVPDGVTQRKSSLTAKSPAVSLSVDTAGDQIYSFGGFSPISIRLSSDLSKMAVPVCATAYLSLLAVEFFSVQSTARSVFSAGVIV